MRNLITPGSLAGPLEAAFDRLWPLHRSLAGPGFLASLDILAEIMPLDRLLFPSGSKALDWTVPPEWHPRQAYILTPDGRRIADIGDNNLHLVGYSMPFRGRLSLAELRKHLHSRPDLPQAIPYVTSYYKRVWGFCLPHALLAGLPEGDYEVVVDTELRDGHVVVAETVLPGRETDEVLLSSYLCHPSMANNELSGPLVLAFLHQALSRLPARRFTYRFVLLPESIGSICYLSRRGGHFLEHLAGGLVLTCLGGASELTYKRSRRADGLMDRAATAVLRGHGSPRITRFNPADGSDERQYCSPGFNLPVGSLSRTPYGVYPEYHTSLDNKDIMDFRLLEDSVSRTLEILLALEDNHVPVNLSPYGEPQLGRRSLYPQLSKDTELGAFHQAIMWTLNLADGEHDLLDIAHESGLAPAVLAEAGDALERAGLLRRDPPETRAVRRP
jgi:aminopeptidase-like protein